MFEGLLLIAYLTACFLLSALTVRARPHGRLGYTLRRKVWLFPALPLLWTHASMRQIARALARLGRGFRRMVSRLFETISGHRTYVRLRGYPYCDTSPRDDLEPAE
jgi:hypothetical protein